MGRILEVPTRAEAETLLVAAERLNPGPWVAHSRNVAAAARAISEAHSDLDPDRSEVLGLLHDIGRREGITSMRHILDGYRFLCGLGFDGAARICMTHSCPLQNTNAVFGKWDCSAEERAFVDDFILRLEYTAYDRLLQLCDTLGLPSGFVLVEKRMIDVALRHGTNDLTVDKWRATFAIKQELEGQIGASIYDVLPGVVENTFMEDGHSS